MTASPFNRRNLLIGLGIAVTVPAGIYGIPRIEEMIEGGPRKAGDATLPPLADDERKLVAAMAEGIIPATDTPGAIGAGVPAFIATIFDEWFLPAEQQAFRDGLAGYDAASRDRFGKPFAQIKAADQLVLLNDWDKAAAAARASHAATLPPFAQFKSLTVIGYYTSEVGQNEELKAQMDGGQDNANGPVMMPLPFNI